MPPVSPLVSLFVQRANVGGSGNKRMNLRIKTKAESPIYIHTGYIYRHEQVKHEWHFTCFYLKMFRWQHVVGDVDTSWPPWRAFVKGKWRRKVPLHAGFGPAGCCICCGGLHWSNLMPKTMQSFITTGAVEGTVVDAPSTICRCGED